MSELRAFIFNCEFGMLISFKDALPQLRGVAGLGQSHFCRSANMLKE
jgi:hypothetical protein